MCEGKRDIAKMKQTLLKIFNPDHVAGHKEIARASNFATNEAKFVSGADKSDVEVYYHEEEYDSYAGHVDENWAEYSEYGDEGDYYYNYHLGEDHSDYYYGDDDN